MFDSVKTATGDFTRLGEATHKLLLTLTDDSLNQKSWAEGRTLGQLAWHITCAIGEMGSKTGLEIDGPSEEKDPVPGSAAEISEAYKKASQCLINELPKLTDSDLVREIDAWGMKWTVGVMLDILFAHEIHHRGQMTILMRQAGLVIPGMMGPAKEEMEGMMKKMQG
jgi:uncharacterized damage-inducible protein DinB